MDIAQESYFGQKTTRIKARAGHFVRKAYFGSDGQLTMRVCAALQATGPNGLLAVLLFRAQKASTRAKKYRGRNSDGESFRNLAYGRKQQTLEQLAEFLDDAGCDGEFWGWQRDKDAGHKNDWILYVELPCGQCSFHSPKRHAGPDFKGRWDRSMASEEVILRFCEQVAEDAYLEDQTG